MLSFGKWLIAVTLFFSLTIETRNCTNLSIIRKTLSAADYIAYARSILQSISFKRSADFFSPKDKYLEELMAAIIYSETESIHAAVFSFTSKIIFDALIDAINRGVEVKMLFDASAFINRYQRASQLVPTNAQIYMFKDPFALMHHKYFLFSNNKLFGKRRVLWHGSANATKSGLSRNCEAVSVTTNLKKWNVYKEEFDNLIKKDARIKLLEKNTICPVCLKNPMVQEHCALLVRSLKT